MRDVNEIIVSEAPDSSIELVVIRLFRRVGSNASSLRRTGYPDEQAIQTIGGIHTVERTLERVDFELCSKSLQNSSHHSGLDLLLESAMADLIRRISIRKFNQGAPVRKTHKIPFRTARRSFQGRPRPSLRLAGSGIRVKDLPLLVCQVTFMAHSYVDAVKQSAHQQQPDHGMVQLELERRSSRLVSIPPFGRGFSRHWGFRSDDTWERSPGEVIVAPVDKE